MQESEFDKQVQHEMEGLRLRPSHAVWENVEKELRRKKRRRFALIFWLLAGFGLLSAGGYWFTRPGMPSGTLTSSPAVHTEGLPVTSSPALPPQPASSDDPSRTSSHVNPSAPSAAPVGNAPDGNNHPGAGAVLPPAGTPAKLASPAKAPSISPTGTIPNKRTALRENTGTEKPVTSPGNRNPAGKKSRPDNHPSRSLTGSPAADRLNHPVTNPVSNTAKDRNPLQRSGTDNRNETSLSGTIKGGSQEEDAPVKTETAAVPANKLANGQTADPVLPASAADSLKVIADSAAAVALALPPAPTDTSKTTPASKKSPAGRKIKWALDLGLGISGPLSSPFSIGSETESTLARDMQSNVGSPITPPGSFGPGYYPRSDINPAPAFHVGVSAEWPLSDRTALTAGLRYTYQSNRIRIGYYTDTTLAFNNYAAQPVAVRAVYQGPQQKTFTNRYHYLELPVGVQWQLNKGKKVPLLLNTGISAAYLINSNALLYDSFQGGIYYYDKNAFNRFQWSFNTGLMFRLGRNQLLSWSLGPEFSMGLRRLIKEDYDQSQYPLYLGIRAKLDWPRKK